MKTLSNRAPAEMKTTLKTAKEIERLARLKALQKEWTDMMIAQIKATCL